MQTYQWNPWSLFDELERSMFAVSSSTWPQFEIEDTDDETVLGADLPGMGEDDVEVTVSGPYLQVRGERKPKAGRARTRGTFDRKFWIGETYDPDRVSAQIENGVLTIRLEKTAKAKPRKIKLTSGLAAKVKGLLTGEPSKDKKAA